MTVADLIQRLPLLREYFPQPIVQEWSLAEVMKSAQAQQERTLAALETWREQSLKIENARSQHCVSQDGSAASRILQR
jgi:hypothetical protein